MPLGDQNVREGIPVELGIPAGPGDRPDIGQVLDAMSRQELDKFVQPSIRVTDRENRRHYGFRMQDTRCRMQTRVHAFQRPGSAFEARYPAFDVDSVPGIRYQVPSTRSPASVLGAQYLAFGRGGMGEGRWELPSPFVQTEGREPRAGNRIRCRVPNPAPYCPTALLPYCPIALSPSCRVIG